MIEYLKQEIDNNVNSNEDPNAKDWNYQTGILLSTNEARLVLRLYLAIKLLESDIEPIPNSEIILDTIAEFNKV